MQDFDYSVEQLAARIGISQPHRILDRLTLLNLKEEYQVLLEDDFLTPTQAYYMSKVPTEFQDTFWRMIRDGRVDTNSLAAVAQGFAECSGFFERCNILPLEVLDNHLAGERLLPVPLVELELPPLALVAQ